MYDMSTPDPPAWAPPNDVEEFKRQYEVHAASLFNHIPVLVQRIRLERDTARTQLATANETIDNLEEQVTQLNLDLNVAHPAPAPAVSVPVAISRLEGRALDQVIPLVNANPAAPFSSVTAFVAHLEALFGDPDPRGTARRQLVALKQGKGHFATYYSQFLRIVAYLDYNEGAKIDALAEGLSEDLKDAMTYRTDRPNTVEAYATMLMTIDNQVRGRKAEQRAIRNTMGQFTAPAAVAHPSHTAGGLAPIDLSTLQARPTQRPAPTPAMSSPTAPLPFARVGTNRL
jgi:hypothetical protein